MNILFVDSHSVCAGRAQNRIFPAEKPFFNLSLFPALHSCVIKFRGFRSKRCVQFLRHVFSAASCSAKNNHRACLRLCKNQRRRLLGRNFFYIIMYVRAVAFASYDMRLSVKKHIGDSCENFRRCCSRKSRYNRNIQSP